METEQPTPNLTLLIWDVPNIDRRVAELVGGRPKPSQRPNPAPLADWLVTQAGEDEIEAVTFFNTESDQDLAVKRHFFSTLHSQGFHVFVKPKRSPSDDVDECMVSTIEERRSRIRQLVLMSQDTRRFAKLSSELVCEGVEVRPLVLDGFDKWPPGVAPVDLYALPGVVRDRVPRLSTFADLPAEGVLLRTQQSMRATVARRSRSEASAAPVAERESLDLVAADAHSDERRKGESGLRVAG